MTFDDNVKILNAILLAKQDIMDGMLVGPAFAPLEDLLTGIANRGTAERGAREAAILACSNALLEIKG